MIRAANREARPPTKDDFFARSILLVNGIVPGTLLLWDVCHGQAGANPVNYALRTTGMLALLFLTASLAVTPLLRLSGRGWLFPLRRTLGLYAFFYATVHFSTFFVFDRALSVASTLSEMVLRLYLVVGSSALVAMVPLAATSSDFMLRAIGAKRWKTLHRLAYVSAAAGALHFYMLVKSDVRKPVAIAGVLALLFIVRGGLFVARRLRRRGTLAALAADEGMVQSAIWRGSLRVERIVRETPDVKTFRLVAPAGGPLPFVFLAGQYLTVMPLVGGRSVVRCYTIASSPTTTGFCEITVKREAAGVVSRFLHDTLKQGDLLAVKGPGGRFTFDGAGIRSVALVAAGVGITPLMSIVRSLAARCWTGEIHLVCSDSTEADILFREELDELQQKLPNLHVTRTLTREAAATWAGERGRIDAAMVGRVLPDLQGTPFYLCGPSGMLAATRELLVGLGVAPADVHVESFGAAALPEDAAARSGDFVVTFARAGRSAPIDARTSILDVAEGIGVAVDSDCRSGTCGRCRCRLISGSVTMHVEDGLDDSDRLSGRILLCQARALGDVTVDA